VTAFAGHSDRFFSYIIWRLEGENYKGNGEDRRETEEDIRELTEFTRGFECVVMNYL